MLFRNDIFRDDKSALHRLLHTDPGTNTAWAINMQDEFAWPKEYRWSDLSVLEAVPATELPSAIEKPRLASQVSAAQRKRANRAWERIEPLVTKIPDIFNPQIRSQLILERSREISCGRGTLFDTLRNFWLGGQTRNALFGNYHESGRAIKGSTTSGRGRLPQNAEREIFQLHEADIAHFDGAIRNDYLTDDRRTITKAFEAMLDQHYVVWDGNRNSIILPEGERPTLRQFENYLRKHYNLEVRLRSRKGDKEFERNNRAKLGTVLQDCQGVGHIYEIDATIVDLYIVSSTDPNKIIGKLTLYLIIDRKTHLIVGFYLGLENASWTGATQAILSISADKEDLCRRNGVEYDPEDWPAHQVFPQQFIADRGSEMLCEASNQISDDLRVTVTNLPGLRPDWKPLVECGFKLVHQDVADVSPAYDPPSNATKRRGKHYEKDASLTVRDATKIILEAIIAHNRRPMPSYSLSLEELNAGIEPVPIQLWNHGIRTRSGLLTRYPEDRVRFALLPRGEGIVTDMGVHFENCYYTCPEANQKGWFVKARQDGRFKLKISHDPRLVDVIYIHDSANPLNYFVATLTARSQKYAGLSRAEVAYYEWLQKKAETGIDQSRLQVNHEFRKNVKPTVDAAKDRLKAAGPKMSRSARRADTKEERTQERLKERQQIATPSPTPDTSRLPAGNLAPVISLVPKSLNTTNSPPHHQQGQALSGEDIPLSSRLKSIRERLING